MSYSSDDSDLFHEPLISVKSLVVACLPLVTAWITLIILCGRMTYDDDAAADATRFVLVDPSR